MTPERYRRAKELFVAALDVPGVERHAFLERACGADRELCDEVASLLRCHEEGTPAPLAPGRIGEAVGKALGVSSYARSGPEMEIARSMFSAGDVVASRYRIESFLDRGGMGEVYRALDLELEIAIALKTMRSHVAARPDAVRRFKREMLLGRSVSHPNVCRFYDVGTHRAHGHDILFLTMELIEGETLEQRLEAIGRLDWKDALPVARQMAQGLDAAHRAGIVHRDFKSANVMLASASGEERVVITDFGLSHAARGGLRSTDEAEATEWLVGTPAYLSPEQLRGEPASALSDLYALGVVLFEMVTGTQPFTGDTAAETARARLERDPPSPCSRVPGLDPRWEEAILRLLRREPHERFACAPDVVRALEGRPASQLPRHNLPPERDLFVAREEVLEELARIARDAQIVTVVGVGGVGKTRVAARFARGVLDQFPGGAWFCDLGEVRDLAGLVGSVAGGLDLTLDAGDPVTRLGHAIAGRGRTLILLDNFEQVLGEAEATVGRWAARAKEAVFLVTSRERLNLRGEGVVEVLPLSVAAGVELFADRARAQRPDFAVNGANEKTLAEIVRLVDGIPLAVELAAARVRMLAPEQLVARLGERLAILAGGHGRHATLRATIDWSWNLLGTAERAALAQLSVFEGGFTVEAAEAVVALSPSGAEAPSVMDAVEALWKKSLLRSLQGTGGEPRLAMYASIQEYAAEKLGLGHGAGPNGAARTHERLGAEERHGTYFAHYGATGELEALERRGGRERRRRLELELDNLLAACRRAIARRDGAMAAHLYQAVWAALELRGPFALGLALGHSILDTLELAAAERAEVLLTLGRAERYAGRLDESRASHEAALAAAVTGDRRFHLAVLRSQAALCFDAGRFDEVIPLLEGVLGTARALGNRGSEADILASVAYVLSQQGCLEDARRQYEAALELLREIGDARMEASVLGRLGVMHYTSGRPDEAERLFEQSAVLARELRDRRSEAAFLSNLGGLKSEQGRWDEAFADTVAALGLQREVGDRRFEAISLGNLGTLHLRRERFDEARACYESALAIDAEVGSRAFEGIHLSDLASLCAEQGRMEQAQGHLEAAVSIHRAVKDGRSLGVSLALLAGVLLALDSMAEASRALGEAEHVLRGIGDRNELAKLLCVRARHEQRAGDRGRAQESIAEAERLAADIGAPESSELGRSLARARETLATG